MQNAEQAGKAAQSHLHATSMRQACDKFATSMRDALVFSSYSVRV
jgi:hypothetical protein